MYSPKLLNIFVQIFQCICSNCQICLSNLKNAASVNNNKVSTLSRNHCQQGGLLLLLLLYIYYCYCYLAAFITIVFFLSICLATIVDFEPHFQCNLSVFFLGPRGPLRVPLSVRSSVRKKNLNHLKSLINHPGTNPDMSYEILPERGQCLLSYGDANTKTKTNTNTKYTNTQIKHMG